MIAPLRSLLLAACIATPLLASFIAAPSAIGAETESTPDRSEQADVPAASLLPPSPHRILSGQLPSAGFLDATSPCLPGANVAALDDAREQARSGDWLAARQLLRSALSSQLPAHGRDALDAALLNAVMKLRPDPGVSQRRELLEALRQGGSQQSISCAHLELARAELLAGLFPEAGTSTLRALRGVEADELADEMLVTYQYLRAEALFHAGRHEQARPFFESVRQGESVEQGSAAKLVAASGMRLATLPVKPDEAPPSPHARYVELKALHDAAQAAHLDTGSWSAGLGELALQAGLVDAAHIWFARAQEMAGNASPEAIRRADALALAGRADEARLLLQHLIERRGRDSVGSIAQIRLADLDLWQDDEAVLRRRLYLASRHLHPRVAAYALDVLAHELLQAGDLDAALAARARLLREDVPLDVVRHAEADLGTLLAIVGAADADCVDVVRRLGSAREVFISHAPKPAPLLRLGDCYLELSMVEPALSVFRSLSRAFGADVTPELPYRLASASYRAGDVPAVEAAVRAALAATDRKDTGRWLLLRARLEFDAEEPQAATRSLLASLAAPGLEAADRRAALLMLARHAANAPAGWQVVAARELENDALWPDHADAVLGEIALHLADASPSDPGAKTWYSLAARKLPAGPMASMRDRAAFQIGELDPGQDASAREPSSNYWTRIVDVDESVARLAARLGVSR